MHIPFMRIDRQFANHRDEIMGAVEKVFEHGRVLQGPEVASFEESLAAKFELPYAVAVNSGTDALILSLKAAGLRPGGKVAVPSLTFVASASAIVHAGGTPVFVDVDEHYMAQKEVLLDLIRTQAVDGIIGVDMYGQLMDLEEIAIAARENGVFLIEDGAQSLGAKRYGLPGGQLADLTCVSFDPMKILGAQGSGGAILTRDQDVAQRLRGLRYHGHVGNRVYAEVGFNSQLATVQAAVLQIKLGYLEEWNTRRVAIAGEYTRRLAPTEVVTTPKVLEGNDHTFHKYVIEAGSRRDDLAAHLKANGVETSIHYELPLHQQPCFSGISETYGSLTNVVTTSKEALSLPSYPDLTDEEVNHICEQVLSFNW